MTTAHAATDSDDPRQPGGVAAAASVAPASICGQGSSPVSAHGGGVVREAPDHLPAGPTPALRRVGGFFRRFTKAGRIAALRREREWLDGAIDRARKGRGQLLTPLYARQKLVCNELLKLKG